MAARNCTALGCKFGECQADGSCVCEAAFRQTIEFDMYNPRSPPDPRFAPCDVLGVVPEALWGIAGVLSVTGIALYLLLWRRYGGKLVHRLPFVVMNSMCAIAGLNRAFVPEAVFFQAPLVTWCVLNWFGMCLVVLGLYLDKQLNAMSRLLDSASLHRVGIVRKRMRSFLPLSLLFMNVFAVATFAVVPPNRRTNMARWCLFLQIPFTGCLFGAAWYASYLLEKQYEGLRTLTSQVQSEHRVAPTGEGSDNDAISVRIRKQLSVLRAIRWNQQYFFLANSTYCFLVFVNDQVFSLAKYLMPGMMALTQLGMAYGVVLQLRLRPGTIRQGTHHKRKQVISADRTASPTASPTVPSTQPGALRGRSSSPNLLQLSGAVLHSASSSSSLGQGMQERQHEGRPSS